MPSNKEGKEHKNTLQKKLSESLQRRASYDMAVGKLERPVETKKSIWLQLYKACFAKKDYFLDSTAAKNSSNDPTYLMLLCAEDKSHSHIESICGCPCHGKNKSNSIELCNR
ncbi:hypothetical protein AAHC03_010030 [Spirometra sp. Aus1]|nr:unnamed protein product [Spirometra erinaceieuropaei]